MQQEVTEHRTVDQRYEPRKAIAEELPAIDTTKPAPESATATAIRIVFEIARNECVLPALRLSNANEYWQWWQQNADRFSGLMGTLDSMRKADEAATERRTSEDETRGRFVARCIEAAEALGGAAGVASVRRALVDSSAAFSIVARFESTKALDDDDRLDAGKHNAALITLDALLVSLYESVDVDVSDGLKRAVYEFPAVASDVLYHAACSAADRRGVSKEFDFCWASEIWPEPCHELAEYLELRAPNLLAGDLQALCNGFDELSDLIGQLHSGKSAASERSRAFVQEAPTSNDVEISRWADALAGDLAEFND